MAYNDHFGLWDVESRPKVPADPKTSVMTRMDLRKAHRARIVFMLWLIVAVLYFSLAAAYIGISTTDDEFGEYLQFAVQLCVTQGRTNRELRQLVTSKAHELEIDLDPARMDIQGAKEQLKLSVSYSAVVEFPLVARPFFHREFEHDVRFTQPR